MAETTSSPPRTSSSSTGVGSRRPPTRRPSAEPLRPLRDRGSAVMTQPLSARPLLLRWTLTVTAAEAAGFLAPAVVGAVTAGLPWYGALPALLAAGAVEGAVLGWAQAAVLRRALPALRGPRWVMLTAVAAVVAYLLGTAIALGSTGSGWAGIVVAAVCGPLLLLSIGGAQWLELRHHVARAATWIPATAVAWLLALAAFLLIATAVARRAAGRGQHRDRCGRRSRDGVRPGGAHRMVAATAAVSGQEAAASTASAKRVMSSGPWSRTERLVDPSRGVGARGGWLSWDVGCGASWPARLPAVDWPCS